MNILYLQDVPVCLVITRTLDRPLFITDFDGESRMHCEFATCRLSSHVIRSVRLSDTCLIFLAVPKKQTFCNSFTWHSVVISPVFS